jgi:NAD(P)-dependent dehydrogenase (short-subunit alcohol dehydrogenase family)
MRTWLISGCSSGIGRAIAEHVLAIGEQAVVTARNPRDVADIVAPYTGRAQALALDVADQTSVSAAVAAAQARFGAIDVLVNNAGFGYVTAIEEGDEDAVRALFDVNFFGALRMVKAVLPDMRRRRQGRIIQIGSLAGRISNPATGYYSSSKFALEAMSEALAREVAPLGIKVTSIAPGMFRTDFSGRSLKVGATPIGDYDEGAHARMQLVRSVDGHQQGDPRKLAAAVVTVADMPEPPIQLLLGPDALRAVTARLQEALESIGKHAALSGSTDFDQ